MHVWRAGQEEDGRACTDEGLASAAPKLADSAAP